MQKVMEGVSRMEKCFLHLLFHGEIVKYKRKYNVGITYALFHIYSQIPLLSLSWC